MIAGGDVFEKDERPKEAGSQVMLVPLVRLAVSAALLLYASACDVATREVPDWIWVLGIPACVLLDGVDLYLGGLAPLALVASVGTAFLLGSVLCVIGFYGGADGRALILMAAALPAYPPATRFILQVLPLPLFFIFVSSTFFSVVYPLTIVTLNVMDRVRGKHLLRGIHEDHRLKRLVLYVTARRVPLETLKAGLQYFPAETVVVEDGEARRTPLYFLHAEADVDDLVEHLEAHRELFPDGVLASPTTPMIVFQTAGFLVTSLLLYGPF